MIDFELTHWFWIVLGIFMMSAELFVPGAFLLWIGLGALFVGGIMFMVPAIPVEIQLLIFAILSLAFGVFGRKYSWYKNFTNDHPNLNLRGEQYIGREVIVTKKIANGKGRVKVGDTEWIAIGDDANEGDSVVVTGVTGTNLIVKNKR